MTNQAEKEQVRLKGLLNGKDKESEDQKVHVLRPSFKPRGTAEQAWRSGATEEEMIAQKMKELQLMAKRKEQNKADPMWKQKEKERQEQRERAEHQRNILQHPLAEIGRQTAQEALWKGQEEKAQSEPSTPVHSPVKAECHYSHSEPTTPIFGSDEDRLESKKKEEARLRAHFLAVHEDRNS